VAPDSATVVEIEAGPSFVYGQPGNSAGPGLGPHAGVTFRVASPGWVSGDSVGIGGGFAWVAFPFGDNLTSLWVPIWGRYRISHEERAFSPFLDAGFGFFLGNATGLMPEIAIGASFELSPPLRLALRAGYPSVSVLAELSF
jgi:hypothetical protein